MEKTVLVIAANSRSGEPCGQPLTFDLTLGKGKATSNSKVRASASAAKASGFLSLLQMVPKSVWTSCVQGVVKYVRVTFDLFPDQRQVCVAAVDYTKCQPVNSWRDEDQELGKVLSSTAIAWRRRHNTQLPVCWLSLYRCWRDSRSLGSQARCP